MPESCSWGTPCSPQPSGPAPTDSLWRTVTFAYVNRMNRLLLTAMQRAATQTGATYVDVYAVSRGHDICSNDPWVNDQYTDPGAALLYHPFAEEQAAVARLILAQLD